MSLAVVLDEMLRQSSIRRSVRHSNHQEHPPPSSPVFRPVLPLSARDSRCFAAERSSRSS
jgi:hypothetical protein